MAPHVHHHDHEHNSTCPTPAGYEDLSVVGTGHHAMYILTGACAAITFFTSVTLIVLHLTRYRAPKEQRQIVRIAFMPFIFALICWAEIADYSIAAYIDPIGEVYESWAICALFLLYIQFAAPKGTFGEEIFQAVSNAAETDINTTGGKKWSPKLSWILVFQYPLTEIIAVIVLEATEAAGTYCATSLKPQFGHLWVQIIRLIGVLLAAMTVIKFYKQMKCLMKARRGVIKLACFKGFVFLHLVQTWVFSILITRDVIHPSDTLSYGDLLYGLPNTLLAVELVLFGLAFFYAFSATEYSKKAHPGKKWNLFAAMADSLNPMDLILGIVRATQLVMGRLPAAPRQGYYEQVDRPQDPLVHDRYNDHPTQPPFAMPHYVKENGVRV